MSRGLLLLTLLAGTALIAGGCANSRSTDEATSSAPPQPAPKPRGWKAYDGERKTDVSALPVAPNATIYGSDGQPVELASFWKDGRALVVFYRGHW